MTSKSNGILKLSESSGDPENFLLSECVRKPIKAPEMIIQDYWPAQTIGLFTGDGGVGKTHFTLQLLYAIATGQDLPGTPFKAKKARPVVYITQEDEASFISQELFHQFPTLGRQRNARKRIRIISTAIKGQHLTLTNKEYGRYITKNVPEGGVFTLDSWSTFLTSNENDATQVLQNEMKSLRDIMKHRQATPLLIHHRPKRNSQTGHQGAFRGTTALPQNCRFHIMLESAGSGVKLSFEKVSRGAVPDPINLLFDGERRLFVPRELDRYVTAFKPGEELTTSEIMKKLGLDPQDGKQRARTLDALRQRSKPSGPLAKISAGKKNQETTWKRK